jgi:hypothetical protein
VVGAEVVGAEVVGAEVVGAEVVGAEVVGAEVVGAEVAEAGTGAVPSAARAQDARDTIRAAAKAAFVFVPITAPISSKKPFF